MKQTIMEVVYVACLVLGFTSLLIFLGALAGKL